MNVVLRTAGDPLAATATLRSAVRALDPNLPIARIRTLDSVVDDALSTPRFAATLLGVFAALALVLAAIGIYGTMALLVAARTPEIGIRLALGAGRSSIFGLIVGHGLAVAATGIAIGVVGAAAASKVLSSLLYGVRALDPLTFGMTTVLLLIAAVAACAIPARRAAAVDPVMTMKS
jgi:putative ABC transport system permease protein